MCNSDEEDAFDDIGEQAVSILAAGNISAAITHSGKLYTWGDAAGCALGHGKNPPKTVIINPRQVSFPAGVKVAVVAAYSDDGNVFANSYMGCVTATGALFTWGEDVLRSGDLADRPFSRLGHGDLTTICLDDTPILGGPSARLHIISAPRQVQQCAAERIVDLCCGTATMMVVTAAGVLLAWGILPTERQRVAGAGTGAASCEMKRIRFAPHVDDPSASTSIRSVSVSQPYAIRSFTSLPYQPTARLAGTHFAAISGSGYAYSWKQFAPSEDGNTMHVPSKCIIEYGGEPVHNVVKSISCGHKTVTTVTTEGHCFVTGMKKPGCLGFAETPADTRRVTLPSAAAAVVSGRLHTAIALANGELYMSGSNNGGQCGNGSQTDAPDEKPVEAITKFDMLFA